MIHPMTFRPLSTQHLLRANTVCTAVAVLVMMCVSSGCATLIGKSKGPLDNIDTTSLRKDGYTLGSHGVMQPLPTEEGKPSIVLEVIDGKRHFEKVPLTPGQPMFVADLIRDAKLYSKIGRIQVKILRPNGTSAPVRLDVDFDDAGKQVMEGMNYSLRPGDHVVVIRDERSMFNRFLGGSVFALSK